MTFGQKLRELRRDSGVTQRQLADRTQLDFSYISKLENDRNPPPAADSVVRICKVLGVPPESLLALTGKLPSDVQESISGNVAAQEFLRITHRLGLTHKDWRHLSQEARRLRGKS
jgi:transcriptional regulator with XRE-family HTH domain